MVRKNLRFQRKKKRASFLRHRYFWYGTAALIIFVSLFSLLVLSPLLQIKEVKVQGVSEIAPEQIVAVVENSFWQSLLGLPQNSILLAKTKDLSQELKETFPVIDRVAVGRSFPRTLLVDIIEREQVGTWCSDAACFALDKKGIVFKQVENEGQYVVFALPETAELGTQLLDPDLLNSLLQFQEMFEKADELVQFSIAQFEIGETSQVEVQSKQGWRILLDTKEDMGWQQTKLQLVLQEKIPLKKRKELEYIDLRFGDQAYLKYRD